MMTYLKPFFDLVNEMSPFLLLGFLFAGLLHVYVPKTVYTYYLSGNNFRSVFYAALLGVPLPLCSCGVIPTAISLRKEGASKSATTAFLIATPQTGIDSILATYSILGLPFAIIRPIAALLTSLFGGALVNCFVSEEEKDARGAENKGSRTIAVESKRNFWNVFRYGYVEMLQDVGKWLIIGLFVAAFITVLVPDAFFAKFADMPIVGMLVVLICAVPMYLCATGSIPIAAALILKGLTPGAAFVMLMAGPAANFASILMIVRTLGKRTMVLYLASIIVGAIAFGLTIDLLLPQSWFNTVSATMETCSHAETPLWKTLSSIVFLLLVIHAFILKNVRNNKSKMENSTIYRIDGMSCNHCKNNVEMNLRKLYGVKSVSVDLVAGTAEVEGEVLEEDVRRTIENIGYEYRGRM